MLHYQRQGHGKTLVLVHGFLGGCDQWQSEIEYLSQHFDVIAPDLPGFFLSNNQKPVNSITKFSHQIWQLLDSLNMNSIYLLGHSMGGMIVQEMAYTHPKRVERLVLYGTCALGMMPDRFESLEETKIKLQQEGVKATAHRVGQTWLVELKNSPSIDLIVKLGSYATMDAAMLALDAMANWDGRKQLNKLTMPTLIIWGDTDRSYLWPQVQYLWQHLKNINLSVIPNASHSAHLDQPEIFKASLTSFLLR